MRTYTFFLAIAKDIPQEKLDDLLEKYSEDNFQTNDFSISVFNNSQIGIKSVENDIKTIIAILNNEMGETVFKDKYDSYENECFCDKHF